MRERNSAYMEEEDERARAAEVKSAFSNSERMCVGCTEEIHMETEEIPKEDSRPHRTAGAAPAAADELKMRPDDSGNGG